MKKILFYSIIICFFSCENKNKEILHGELHFKLVEMIPLNGFSEEKINQMRKNQKEIEKEFPLLLKLDKLNLLNSPHLNLKLDDGSVKMVFFDSTAYNKISKYDLNDLLKENNKVYLSLEAEKIEDEVYYCEKIIDVKELKGNPSWEK